jgi:glycosyltransferase involved in cell wall biosynthesis
MINGSQTGALEGPLPTIKKAAVDDDGLRIGVAALSRFHMFDLARELRRLDQQVTLYTGYPKLKVEPDLRGIAKTHSRFLIASTLAGRVSRKNENWWARRTYQEFGLWLTRQVLSAPPQVFDALDGLGLEAGPMVRRNGGIWLCNRGSAHILKQRELVQAELDRWGGVMPRNAFDPWMVERTLAEYEEADCIVVPSKFARDTFLKRGHSPARVVVCPYGVDLDLFAPVPKEDKKFRIIFVGSQSLQKGIGYLFEAIRPLVKNGAVELWMVGPPAEDGNELLKKNEDLFTHKGTQPRSALSWYYSQASALVLPSIQEGLALVQAQAMACGVPVIATTHTGAEDLFSDGVEGFIVAPRDSGAIRERIQFLIDNPNRRAEMSQAARERVRTLGGWRDYGRCCLSIYRRLWNACHATTRH